jgi:lipopolysaccharide export system protein LptA
MLHARLRGRPHFACMLAALPRSRSSERAAGFSQNKDKPVQIEAASLEVRDKDKVATFSGDVNVTQGDTNMRCKSLLVFYDQDSKRSGGMKAAQPGPAAILDQAPRGARRVIVTQKEQTATGETGIFDMKTNTITLRGKVTVTQGQNVLRGDRLVVDIATGAARVESGGGACRPVRAEQRGQGVPQGQR